MSFLERGNAKLYYEYDPPRSGRQSFVFVNALTGSEAGWQAEIGPALRKQGYGTLAYDLRGQENSPAAPDDELNEALNVADLRALLAHVDPRDPVLVGLSIGGLFAARAWLAGSPAQGLVLINTLSKPSLALDWINEAAERAAAIGGQRMLMDMFLPFLAGPAKLAELRDVCLTDQAYVPFTPDAGTLRLLCGLRAADWDLPYESLTLPVLILSGLRDRVYYDRAVVAELISRLPDARQIDYPDLGHLIPAEDGRAVVTALLDFAAGISGKK